MLVAELQEVRGNAVADPEGQQLGVLTGGDVAAAVSEVGLDRSDVESLYGHLEEVGIELVEDIDPAEGRGRGGARRGRQGQGRKRQKQALDLKPDMTTDSLQLFFKDISESGC